MLPQQNRMISKFEFNVTRKHGNHIEGDLVHIYALRPRGYLGPTKFGFVVSNKFEKVAPKRNAIKRILREAVRVNFENLDLENNLWIVIQPKKDIKDSAHEKINSDLIKNLQKISIPH